MKKWIIPIMFILLISIVSGQVWTKSDGGQASDNGLWTVITNFFTGQEQAGALVCSVTPSFVQETTCTGGQDPSQNLTTYDSTWVSCCQLGGPCYLNDTAANNQSYLLTDVPCGDRKMELVAISIILIGVMFWLVHVALNINVRNDTGKIAPINAMLVLILFVSAGYIAFFALQTALGIALDNSVGDLATTGVKSIFQFNSAIVILILFILFFGIIINVGQGAIEWVQKKLFGGANK